jgi:hypothetical protein
MRFRLNPRRRPATFSEPNDSPALEPSESTEEPRGDGISEQRARWGNPADYD